MAASTVFSSVNLGNYMQKWILVNITFPSYFCKGSVQGDWAKSVTKKILNLISKHIQAPKSIIPYNQILPFTLG